MRHPRALQYPSHRGGGKITPLFCCERCLIQLYHESFFPYTAIFIKHRSLHCWADSIKKISIDHQTPPKTTESRCTQAEAAKIHLWTQSSPRPPRQQFHTRMGDQRGLQLCSQVIKGLFICSQAQVENAARDWPRTATEHKGDTAKKVTRCRHLARNCSERTKDFTSFTENKERRKVERKETNRSFMISLAEQSSQMVSAGLKSFLTVYFSILDFRLYFWLSNKQEVCQPC